MNRSGLLFVSLLGLIPLSAQAFWYHVCEGEAVRWGSSSVTLKRLPISFPDGSTQTTSFQMAEARWNGVSLANFNFEDVLDNDDYMEWGEDGNEVGFFDPEELPEGAGGATWVSWSECDDTPGLNMEIVETDIMFPTSVTSGLYGELGWNLGTPSPRRGHDGSPIIFRAVALHELGHALGSALTVHTTNGIATMGHYPTGGWYPGNRSQRVRPHGDDRIGIQFLYPGQGTIKADIAVLNFKKDDDFETTYALLVSPLMTGWGAPICPQDNFYAYFSLGNPGDVPVIFDLAFYLSLDTTYDDSDILLDVDTWYSGYGILSYEPSLDKLLTLPAGVTGSTARTYYVLVFADYEDEIDEVRETNNVVAVPGEITVRPSSECP